MTIEEFVQQLTSEGFNLIGVPDYTGGNYVLALHLADGFELMRVELPKESNTVRIIKGKSEQMMTRNQGAINKALEIAAKIDTYVVEESDVEAAKLVREIKTLRLKPEDRLVITVKEDLDKKSLETLREAVLGWLGEKRSSKILILNRNIEFTKIRNEDGSNNQE